MKRFFLFSILFIGAFICILFCDSVSAKQLEGTLVKTKLDQVYYSRRGGGKKYFSEQFSIYTMNGEVAYCIEVNKSILNNDYIGELGMINSPYSDEINQKIQLIGHYGYNYPEHQTREYRLATQALIWEETYGQIVEFWTENYGNGNNIDVSKEKEEIMRLVNSHYILPSFNDENISTVIGNQIVLEDSNMILNNFEIESDGGNEVSIIDNKIYITPKKTGKSQIRLAKKKYDNTSSAIFVGTIPNSQRIAIFRADDPVYSVINVNTTGAKLKVIKLDSETNSPVQIAGIKFKIKNLNTNSYVCQIDSNSQSKTICEYETDSNGIMITPNVLESGDYELEEVQDQIIDGYLWNSKTLKFSIDEKSTFINDNEYGAMLELQFKNTPVKGEVEVYKNGEKAIKENGTFYYKEIKLDNVTYELYADEDIYSRSGKLIYESGKLVDTYTTKDGYFKISDLYLGKYCLIETATVNGHLIDSTKHCFTLTYQDQYTPIVSLSFTFNNYLKKGGLDFTKKDLTTGKEIPNVKFEIYDAKDDQLIFSGNTDEAGKIQISNLYVGKFYIVEKEPQTGYKLNDERVYFEILEDGQIVKAEMTNEMITGDFELTKTDFSTGEPVSGALIEIYDENENLVFSGYTDESGKIYVEGLKYGRYKFIESKAPEGYILNAEEHFFEILEDGEVIKDTLENKKKIIEVPDTFQNESRLIKILSGCIITCGLGIVVYEKKKK